MGNTEIFEKMAKRYDTEERIRIAKQAAEAIRKYLDDTQAKQAIDFGCGTGLVGLNLFDEFQTVVFIDSAQNMIDVVDRKIEELAISNATTLCVDLEKEAHIDLKADYIFMSQVLLHVKDIKPLLERLYGMLNDGGRLMIVDFDKNEKVVSDMVHNGFEQAALKKTLATIGYQAMASQTFFSGENIFMNQDASLFVLAAQK